MWRSAISGVAAAGIAALSPLPAMPATGTIPALFPEWEAAWGPDLAALKEYSRAEEAFFADRNNLAKIIKAPAVTVADIRCKRVLGQRRSAWAMGDGNIEGANTYDHEILLRLPAMSSGSAERRCGHER